MSIPTSNMVASMTDRSPKVPIFGIGVFNAAFVATVAGAICWLDYHRIVHPLGWAAPVGLEVFFGLIVLGLATIMSGERARAWLPVLGALAVPILLDVLTDRIWMPLNSTGLFIITAFFVLLAACQVARLEKSTLPVRAGWLLLGSLLLAMTMFNVYNVYEEMHLLWGAIV